MLKTSKRWYKDYINPTPKVDLAVQADEECAPTGFADLFVPVDTRLNALERDLSTQDTYPRDEWFDVFLQRYPWIGNIVAVNVHGEVLAEREIDPGYGGGIDYASLCGGDDWKDRLPRATILASDAGNIVCLAMPFFKDSAWKGCLIVSFAFEKLAGYSPSPQKLVILGQDREVLWPGGYAKDIQGLANHDWSSLLEDRSSGRFSTSQGTFFWLGRSLAGRWLVYISRIQGG